MTAPATAKTLHEANQKECRYIASLTREAQRTIEGSLCMGVPRPIREQWSELRAELDVLTTRAEFCIPVHTRQVAVVGRFSAGKSTLINALLGQHILPSAVEPLTTLPTFLRHAETCYAELKTHGSLQWQGIHINPLRKILRGDTPRPDAMQARISCPTPILKSIGGIIDAPGWDSPETAGMRHGELADTTLQDAHAVVVVTRNTGIDERCAELLTDLLNRPEHVSKPLAIAVNQIDLLDADDAITVLTEARQRLRRLFPAHAHRIAVFGVSALAKLEPGSVSADAVSHLDDLEAWVRGDDTRHRQLVGADAFAHAALTRLLRWNDAVRAWRLGDWERSWPADSPEAEATLKAWEAESPGGLRAFALKEVRDKIARHQKFGDVPKTLTLFKALKHHGFEYPEVAARHQILAATRTALMQFEKRLTVYLRDNERMLQELCPTLLPVRSSLKVLLGRASTGGDNTQAPTGYRISLWEADAEQQVAVLRERWQSRTDEGRAAEFQRVSARLQAALSRVGESDVPSRNR